MDLESQAHSLQKMQDRLDMDVGTVQSPAVNVTMPGQRQGTPVPQQNPAR